MVDIPLELRSQLGGKKPQQPVEPGEIVNWVPSGVEVVFTTFEPAEGELRSPGADNNLFEDPPKLTNNTVKENAPFGRYFYEVRFNGILVGEGTIPRPRNPPDTPGND